MNSRQNFIYRHFSDVIRQYNGELPFHHFFKNYCNTNKSLGAKDRKILKEIFYTLFRQGNYYKNNSELLFLTPNNKNSSNILKDFYTGLPESNIPKFDYPYKKFLSHHFNNNNYFESFKIQPLVWLRVLNKELKELEKLYKDSILEKEIINDKFSAIGFAPNTLFENDKFSYVIQDLSSQIASSKIKTDINSNVWDCCSGSGGKSLFVYENNCNIKLFASDKRLSVLNNLIYRFKQKRLKIPEIAEIDLEKNTEKLNFNDEKIVFNFFDTIIADVPCSGSGTWSREPENLYFFDEDKLNTYFKKQSKILNNALKFLKPFGKLYYITCSVFEYENSKVLEMVSAENKVECLNIEYIKGYNRRADNMFIAEILKKN